MRKLLAVMTVVVCLVPIMSYAAAPANAPAGTTGMCKDGTYYSGPTKQGACKGHKGVKEWYGTLPAAPPVAAGQSTPPAATPAPAASKPAATPPTAAGPAKADTAKGATAAGGGPGQVWVNMATKVYHCPGNRWYGKTKQGGFMSEADAKAKGYKPDHGKACG